MPQAVIDRFDGQIAVLLVGPERKPFDAPRWALPRGVRAGDWLIVEIEAGVLKRADVDQAATEAARKQRQ